jgi:hydroxymethylbilane synthase
MAERSSLEGIDGSCHRPIGAYCKVEGENLELIGLFGDEEGYNITKKSIKGKVYEAREIGMKLAKLVLEEYMVYEG